MIPSRNSGKLRLIMPKNVRLEASVKLYVENADKRTSAERRHATRVDNHESTANIHLPECVLPRVMKPTGE